MVDFMELKLFQKGFNYSQDGPGNRLIYHLKGCNLTCPWCSNPEGMSISENGGFTLTVEQLVNEAKSCMPMFFDGGGITFTGGEATCQAPQLKQALLELTNSGINTCIETNGTYKNLPDLFPIINHLIIDLKHPDNTIHKELLGLGNEVIKDNIFKAAKSHRDLLVRIPLINGINTSDETVDSFIEFFKSTDYKNYRIELLKYHEYGKDKWQKCGKEYTVKNANVSEQLRLQIENKMKNNGLNIVRT